MSIALIAALVTAVGAPLAAYLAALRRLSGKVGTSDAAQLWEESRAIRDWATKRIEELNTLVERLERKVSDLEGGNNALARENGHLTTMLEEHERTIGSLRQQVSRLSSDNARLHKENTALLARVTELENVA